MLASIKPLDGHFFLSNVTHSNEILILHRAVTLELFKLFCMAVSYSIIVQIMVSLERQIDALIDIISCETSINSDIWPIKQ